MELNHLSASYPLSPLQQGILFHHLYAPQSGVYIELVIRLHENLNVPAFERAWQAIVERHTVLRTSFEWVGLDQPRQKVHKRVNLLLAQQDWRGLTVQAQEDRLAFYLQTDRQRGFELTEAPLMRLALFRLGDTDYQCVWTFHHILLDGRSLPVILSELFAFYKAFCHKQSLHLESPRPYQDYIDWWQQQDPAQVENFWRNRLKGFTRPTPLTVDRLFENGVEAPTGYATQEIRLAETTTSALQALAQQHQLTFNTLLQGAWALLLSRYSRETEVVFGATRACRRSTIDGAEAMVGLFINTLPLRIQVFGDMLLLPWLKELRAQNLALREAGREHTPLVKVQEWSDIPRGLPLFESLLVFENYDLNTTLRAQGGAWANRQFRLLEQTTYPLTLNGYLDAELRLKISYAKHRFDDQTIGRMLDHLQTLLESMATNPAQKLAALPILTETERQQLPGARNDALVSYPASLCLHQRFELQASFTPEAIALVFGEVCLTYRELNQRANQVAHYLQTREVGPGTLVGLCLERSLEMVIAILGVLKAGGAYLPLDLVYPRDRLAFILQDADTSIIVTESHLLEKLPPLQTPLICLDTVGAAIAQESQANPVSRVTADHLAYVIYTSGSTGQPKGTLISHRHVGRLFEATHGWFNFGKKDVWTLFHSYAFDFSVWELWGALLYGGRLVIVPYWVSRSPEEFYHLLASEQVTVLNQTPSAFWQLVQLEERLGSSQNLALRLIIFGGEALELAKLKPWFERHGDQMPQLVNMYGITETSVHVTYRPVTAADATRGRRSLIGGPIPDLQLYLLDSSLQPVPVGVPGELYVGGAGLAYGYLNRPELTAERFIPHPFSRQPGARLYKSGDLARYLPNGDIEYLGRIDHQVKVRGFRIELGEIETVLTQHPAVREAVVLIREDNSAGKQLVAYLIPHHPPIPPAPELHRFLKQKLPDYMLPAAFVALESFPLTPNGKIDHQALPVSDLSSLEEEKGFVPPRDALEAQLIKIWEEVLGRQPVSIKSNFFEVGGHSLLAVRVLAQMEKIFGQNLPLAAFFQTPTVEQLANAIRKNQTGAVTSPSSLVALQPAGSKPPFFCVPGNLGNVFVDLGDLARHLGPDQPFYGLQDGPHNPSRIEAVAAYYLSEIRSVQPEGPYLLGGVCWGGIVAFEIAQQLQTQGQRVALLVLIEPAPPPFHKIPLYFNILKFLAFRMTSRFGYHSQNLLQYDLFENRAYLGLKTKLVANMAAVAHYKIQPFPGRITLLLAQESSTNVSCDPRLNWQKLTGGGLKIYTIPGSHDTITRDHNATPDEYQLKVLAEYLRGCLETAMLKQ